jgi:rod shape-determining protein MreB
MPLINQGAQHCQPQQPEPFSHPRMLVGHFLAAELAVKAAVAEVKGSKLFHTTRVLMPPMERLEGGLTQIERRVLHEMALTAGAGKSPSGKGMC